MVSNSVPHFSWNNNTSGIMYPASGDDQVCKRQALFYSVPELPARFLTQ